MIIVYFHMTKVTNLGAFLKLMHHRTCCTPSKSFQFYLNSYLYDSISWRIQRFQFLFVWKSWINWSQFKYWSFRFTLKRVIEVRLCFMEVRSSQCLEKHSHRHDIANFTTLEPFSSRLFPLNPKYSYQNDRWQLMSSSNPSNLQLKLIL